jgi:hypothetical protein
MKAGNFEVNERRTHCVPILAIHTRSHFDCPGCICCVGHDLRPALAQRHEAGGSRDDYPIPTIVPAQIRATHSSTLDDFFAVCSFRSPQIVSAAHDGPILTGAESAASQELFGRDLRQTSRVDGDVAISTAKPRWE